MSAAARPSFFRALGPDRRMLAGFVLVPLGLALGFVLLERPYALHGVLELLYAETTPMSLALAGVFVMHAHDLPEGERRNALLLGVLVDAIWIGIRVALGVAEPLNSIGRGLGLVAIVLRARRYRGTREAADARRLLDVSVLPILYVCSLSMLDAVSELRPTVLDPYFAPVEEATGATFAARVGALFEAAPSLRGISFAVYGAFVFGIGGAHALQKDDDARARLLRSFWLASFIGYSGYVLVPLIGPEQFYEGALGAPSFRDTSFAYTPFTSLAADPALIRNCMPSLHTTWAILVALSLSGRPRWRVAGVFWVLLTELATLGGGAHWIVDLAIAFPFAVTMHAAFLPQLQKPRFWLALASVFVGGAAWVFAHLFFGPQLARHPALFELALALTALSAIPLYRWLLPAQAQARQTSAVES